MNGKENVIRAIEFAGPAYLPVVIGVDPDWLREKDQKKLERIYELATQLKYDITFPTTFVHSIGEKKKEGTKFTWVDEWGTGWEDSGFGSRAITFPLEGGYEMLEGYKFPDSALGPHILLQDVLDKYDGTTYLLSTVWFTLFSRLWLLRGFENMLVEPYTDTEDFEKLRDRVLEFNLERIDGLLKLNMDGIYFSDDWGSQKSLLMNPDDWRKYYKPSYQKMFQRVHEGGAHVWMHLCGNIRDILPDLVEIGLDVLNAVQPQSMDLKELSETFGGKLCFNGGVDVQGTMVNGTPEEVKNAVYEVTELFGKFNGGYIGATSHSLMPETPLDNIIALYEAFLDIQKR